MIVDNPNRMARFPSLVHRHENRKLLVRVAPDPLLHPRTSSVALPTPIEVSATPRRLLPAFIDSYPIPMAQAWLFQHPPALRVRAVPAQSASPLLPGQQPVDLG